MSWTITGSQKVNWDPSLITTALWLDAADSSTLFTTDTGSTLATNGSAVGRWEDKSGNGRHAKQTTAGNRPTHATAAQNNRGIIEFTRASSHYLRLDSTALFNPGNAGISIIAAYKSKMGTQVGTLIANFGETAGNFAFYFGGSVLQAYTNPWGVYNAGNVDIDSGSHVNNANYIVSLVRSSGSFTGWTDGTQKNTVVNTTSVYTGANTQTAWNLGSNGGGTPSDIANMDLYELICINSSVSQNDRERTEGYLAHKWGLTANLPSNHPYKAYPPAP